MLSVFAILITLCAAAAGNLSKFPGIAPGFKNHFQDNKNSQLCETPACVHTASSILKNMDASVDPCDNFYQFACGKFMEETIIPDKEFEVDIFKITKAKLDEKLRLEFSDEIKENDQPVIKKMKTYYQTCIDTDQIEKNSENDLREILKSLGGCPVLEGASWNETNFDWKRSMYESNKMGYSTNLFFSLYMEIDPDNSSRQIISIGQAALEFPRPYLLQGKDNDLIQAELKSTIEMVERLGANRTQAETEMNDMIDFEIELAKISLSDEQRQDESKLNKRMTLQQLETNFPGVAWTEYLNEILAPHAHVDRSEEVIAIVPSFLERFPKLMAKTPNRVLANYVCYYIIGQSRDGLSNRISSISTEVTAAVLGEKEVISRHERCFDNVFREFSPAIGWEYTKHYFDKNSKTDATDLANSLRNTLEDLIKKVHWMDNATKLVALEKLDSMASHIGYPDTFDGDKMVNEDYGNLTLYPKSYLKTQLSLRRLRKANSRLSFRKPVEKETRSYGFGTTEDVYFNVRDNSLNLPTEILQDQLYNKNRPNYLNYGAIGPVIGREISHTYDNMGRLFDKNGNAVDWWNNETKQKYLKKAKCFIEQYSNYTIKEVNATVDGEKTQDRNIARHIGLRAAYFAYKKWVKKNGREPRLPGLKYTPRQMFWISYANTQCSKVRQQTVEVMSKIVPYVPSEFRVIGAVSNLYRFSKDFQCPVGSPMNPVKKCSV